MAKLRKEDRAWDGEKQIIAYVPQFVAKMTDIHKEALDSHVLKGTPLTQVVELLRSWGYCKDVRTDTVYKSLTRYKKENILPKQIAQTNNVIHEVGGTKVLEQSLDKLRSKLDPIKELERLALIQRGRVEKMIAVESKAPALLDSQTKNITLYADILNDLTKTHMATGLIKKVPLQHEVSVNEGQKALQESIVTGQAPIESTTRVLQELQKYGFLRDVTPIDVVPRLPVDAETVEEQ